MLIVCEDCGHKQQINVSERFRMDIEKDMGGNPRCEVCESDKICFI
jgi:hypothetical protein